MRTLSPAELIAPTYLSLCLLLGGASAAGFIANALLQIVAVILIAGFALRPTSSLMLGTRGFTWLVAATVTLVLYQLIPLPAALWSHLPGRADVSSGYRLLGVPLPVLPLSLDADATIAGGLGLLPPIAMAIATIRASSRSRRFSVYVLIAAALASTVVGALQLSGGENSRLYFYEITNATSAVGFFANSNHLATLFLVALPCVAALAASDQASARRRRAFGSRPMLAGLIVFLCFGVVLNRSLAGLSMLAPVLLICFAVWRHDLATTVSRWWILGGTGAIVAVLAIAFLGPVSNRLQDKALSTHDPVTRRTTNILTIKAAADHLPFGTGLGTFVPVYAGYENPETISTTYVNHAHDDYAELLLETGLPGAALLVAWLIWYVRRTRDIWTGDLAAGALARAGTAIIGVVLVHSLVDYPARTAAIGAAVAMAFGLLAAPVVRKQAGENSTSRGRHARAD